MDKARKKELKAQYKVMKPDMGVFMISSRVTKKCQISPGYQLPLPSLS
jgi:hypothetical protein